MATQIAKHRAEITKLEANRIRTIYLRSTTGSCAAAFRYTKQIKQIDADIEAQEQMIKSL